MSQERLSEISIQPQTPLGSSIVDFETNTLIVYVSMFMLLELFTCVMLLLLELFMCVMFMLLELFTLLCLCCSVRFHCFIQTLQLFTSLCLCCFQVSLCHEYSNLTLGELVICGTEQTWQY